MRRSARSMVRRSIRPAVVVSPSTALATKAFASQARSQGGRPMPRQADTANSSMRTHSPYPGEFADLDYALRKGGWLEEFLGRPQTWLYAAEQSGELVAFTILAATAAGEAEFRIALRPDKGGQGLGRIVAAHTLEKGFDEIGLRRIHLIVRNNNPRAIRLYQCLGFVHRGECCQVVNHRLTDFLLMDIFSPPGRQPGLPTAPDR